MKVVIVGGGGFIGYHIGAHLVAKKNHTVILLDIVTPRPEWVDISKVPFHEVSENFISSIGIECKLYSYKCNILDLEGLKKGFQGAQCVIHCASYGMSGKEQMLFNWSKTEQINVQGTLNVIKACSTQGVEGLVYTSSFNVVFGGEEIINGNEDLPYFPLHKHVDHYSRTKSIAEQMILISDGKTDPVAQIPLKTTALRLNGVFGPGETRHLPRIVKNIPYFKFQYGSENNLVQFCTLKNVVQAHVKAAEALCRPNTCLRGEAYFISDEKPINNFEFFRPLFTELGYEFPTRKVPMWVMWLAVYVINFVFGIVMAINPKWGFTPPITAAEVYKTGVTHYCSSEKARRHFGYVAERPNDISEAIEVLLKERGQCNKRK